MGLFKTDVIDEVVAVDEIESVREARALVLKARERLAAAKVAAARFQPGTITLAAAAATEELEAASQALPVAEQNLETIRNRERHRIRADRLPGERELRQSLLAALEEARDRLAVLQAWKDETDRLADGRPNFEVDPSHDWPELLTLDDWRAFCEAEGLL